MTSSMQTVTAKLAKTRAPTASPLRRDARDIDQRRLGRRTSGALIPISFLIVFLDQGNDLCVE